MRITYKPTPQSVYKDYRAGLDFNNGIELYRNVETNENFFIGKQWEGVKSNGLPTPVFNFLKRVVLFSVANVSTDNLKLHAENMPSTGERDPHTMWGNLWGQICPQFAALWCLVSGPVIVGLDWMRYAVRGGERPHYKWK